MAQRKDLTGQRFGKLVALSPTEKRRDDGSVVWRCRCDCGREAEVSARRLTRGKVRSCGCLSHPPRKNYTDVQFGRLTVTGYAGTAKDLGKSGTANFWRCRCACGRETVVSQTELQNGGTQSCGCLQKERVKESLLLVEDTSVAILSRGLGHPPRKDNTSGHTGVFCRRDGKWIASISFRKKRYYLGCFNTLEEAVRAREQGEQMHEDFLSWYYVQHPEKAKTQG